MPEQAMPTLDLAVNKEKFIQIFKGEIHRDGADQLLVWLESTDFFTAPHTGQYVLSCKGGACLHAINTYKALYELIEKYRASDPYFLCDPDVIATGTDEEKQQAIAEVNQSIAIAGLLSEVGVANSWIETTRNEKQPDGKWVAKPAWKFDEEFVFGGMGGKSVFIIQQFMRLYIEEAQAIRFHKMGKEVPYGGYFEDSFYTVYENNLFACLVGAAHNEAHNISDRIVWDRIKPR